MPLPGLSLLHPRLQAGGAHLQVVLDSGSALVAPDGRDPTVGRGGRRSASVYYPARAPPNAANVAIPPGCLGPRPDGRILNIAPALPSRASCPRGPAPVLPTALHYAWGSVSTKRGPGNVLKVGAQVLEIHEVARPHRTRGQARAHGGAGMNREARSRAGDRTWALRARARSLATPSLLLRLRLCLRPAPAALHTRPRPPWAGAAEAGSDLGNGCKVTAAAGRVGAIRAAASRETVSQLRLTCTHLRACTH